MFKKSFIFAPIILAVVFLGFGGRILNTTSCSNGLLLNIGQPRPGLYMWNPGTLTFSWYQLRPPAWVLGTFAPGGACVCPNGCCKCGAIPALGTIKMVGTSSF